MRVVLPWILGAVFACGPGAKQVPHDLDESGDERLELDTPAEDAPPTPELTGAVARTALLEVLDAGPGAFLAGIEMNAHFSGKRFDGWEIVHFWPGDPRYAAVDVRPGDVIATVNGQGLQRPENLFDVWTALRAADEIVVVGLRAGGPLELRFAVHGAARADGDRRP